MEHFLPEQMSQISTVQPSVTCRQTLLKMHGSRDCLQLTYIRNEKGWYQASWCDNSVAVRWLLSFEQYRHCLKRPGFVLNGLKQFEQATNWILSESETELKAIRSSTLTFCEILIHFLRPACEAKLTGSSSIFTTQTFPPNAYKECK